MWEQSEKIGCVSAPKAEEAAMAPTAWPPPCGGSKFLGESTAAASSSVLASLRPAPQPGFQTALSKMMSAEQAARLSAEVEQGGHGGDAAGHIAAAATLQVARYARSYAADFGQALSSAAALRSAVSAALRASTIAARFAALSTELDEILTERHAFATFRAAAGYQNWLLAPEAGVRALLRECLQLCSGPMLATVDAVHAGLLGAATAAQARLGAPGGPELGADAIYDLEARATAAMDAWRAETAAQLRRLLAAEAGFPPADAFAALKRELEVVGRAGGGAKQPRSRAAAAEQGDKEQWNSFFMGWLSKRNRWVKARPCSAVRTALCADRASDRHSTPLPHPPAVHQARPLAAPLVCGRARGAAPLLLQGSWARACAGDRPAPGRLPRHRRPPPRLQRQGPQGPAVGGCAGQAGARTGFVMTVSSNRPN